MRWLFQVGGDIDGFESFATRLGQMGCSSTFELMEGPDRIATEDESQQAAAEANQNEEPLADQNRSARQMTGHDQPASAEIMDDEETPGRVRMKRGDALLSSATDYDQTPSEGEQDQPSPSEGKQ